MEKVFDPDNVDRFGRYWDRGCEYSSSMGSNILCVKADDYDHLLSLYKNLMWKLITSESLPKEGDEVGGEYGRMFCEHVTKEEEAYSAKFWRDLGYKWHRPINIPKDK